MASKFALLCLEQLPAAELVVAKIRANMPTETVFIFFPFPSIYRNFYEVQRFFNHDATVCHVLSISHDSGIRSIIPMFSPVARSLGTA